MHGHAPRQESRSQFESRFRDRAREWRRQDVQLDSPVAILGHGSFAIWGMRSGVDVRGARARARASEAGNFVFHQN